MLSRHHYLFKRAVGSVPNDQQLPLVEGSDKTGLPFADGPVPTEKAWFKSGKLWFILKFLILSSACVVTLFHGQSIIGYATSVYHALLPDYKVHQGDCNQFAAPEAPEFVAKPPMGKLLTDTTKPTCSSSKSGHKCELTTDADVTTDWQTADGAPLPDLGGNLHGHWVAIDLGQDLKVHSLAMTPREDAKEGGAVSKHVVQISTDGNNWQDVAYGTWFSDTAGTDSSTIRRIPQR